MQHFTRILATLGPASSGVERIRALAQAGADVFRVNFSHGVHADYALRIAQVRQVEQEIGRPLGLLMDLPSKHRARGSTAIEDNAA